VQRIVPPLLDLCDLFKLVLSVQIIRRVNYLFNRNYKILINIKNCRY